MAKPSDLAAVSLLRYNQVATNFQLIEGAAKGTATQIAKTTKYTIERISATDEQNDLAILEIKGSEVEPLPLADSDAVKTGEIVYLAGNPQGLEGSFSNDTISSVREEDAKKRFQMTTLISPGNSGGPVLNEKGEVIGVSFMVLEGGQNLNVVIPSNNLKELLARSGGAKPLWQGKQSISAETHLKWGYAKYRLDQYKAASKTMIPLSISNPILPALTTFGELRSDLWENIRLPSKIMAPLSTSSPILLAPTTFGERCGVT